MIAGYAGALELDEGKDDCRYAGYAGALVLDEGKDDCRVCRGVSVR